MAYSRNHNWFQCLSEPLPQINSTNEPLTPLQTRRLAFYRSWVSLVRAFNGDVIVAYTPTTATSSTDIKNTDVADNPSPGTPAGQIAAVVLLLPPHARPSWSHFLTAYNSGLVSSLLGFGLRGFCRVAFKFEGNVGNMITRGLKERNIADGKEVELLFVHGCVRNPEWEGVKGPARKLLSWGIQRWWERNDRIPVWLDSTTDEGERAYAEIGFKVLSQCMINTGCDENGIKLKKDANESEVNRGKKIAKQRVMIWVPEAED
jgi:hypothetical protein